jgi:hypothetical protein
MSEATVQVNQQEKTARNKELGVLLHSMDGSKDPDDKKRIAEKLPDELRINPADTSVDSAQVKDYLKTLRDVWEDADLPEKRTVAKYILMATANADYTEELSAAYPRVTEEKLAGMSELRRNWIDYSLELYVITKNFLAASNELSTLTGLSAADREKVVVMANEKMFVYQAYIQMLAEYPEDMESNLELLMERTGRKDLMERNFEEVKKSLGGEREQMGEAEWKSRMEYFSGLSRDRVGKLCHYSPHGNIDPIIGGRRVMDKLMAGLYDKYDESEVFGLINKAIITGDEKIADQVVRYYRQDALRAVDRVNDVMLTDRFIYTLLEGQTKSAPVRNLEFIYKFDAKELADHGLHYYAPTHPQALHVMKMQRPYDEMPQILADTVTFFAQGMYTPEDFAELYPSVFAATFSEDEISPEMFNFVFENVVVNEESKVSMHSNGRFVADEWLVLSEEAVKDPMHAEASKVIKRINEKCKALGFVPPLRPYAVVDKDVSVRQFAKVEKNPAKK